MSRTHSWHVLSLVGFLVKFYPSALNFLPRLMYVPARLPVVIIYLVRERGNALRFKMHTHFWYAGLGPRVSSQGTWENTMHIYWILQISSGSIILGILLLQGPSVYGIISMQAACVVTFIQSNQPKIS